MNSKKIWNAENANGIEIMDAIKLEITNWFDCDLFPPSLFTKIGTAVIGGTQLIRNIKNAIENGGFINIINILIIFFIF